MSGSLVPGERVPRRRSVTRERILQAAEAVFLEKGFHGASVESVATRAGYTTGAIYSNFGNKDELFLAVSERRYHQMFLEQWDSFSDASSAEDIAAVMAKIIAESAETSRSWAAVGLEFMGYAIKNPRAYPAERAMMQRATGEWKRMFAPVAEKHGIPAEKFAPILWALLSGLNILWLTDESIDEADLLAFALSRIMPRHSVLSGNETATDTNTRTV